MEERESKFVRFISSSFHALSFFLHSMDPSQLKKDNVKSSLEGLLNDKKLWKYVKNSSPLVSSFKLENRLINEQKINKSDRKETCI